MSFITVNLFADEPPDWVDMEGKPWIKFFLDPSSSEYLKVLNRFKASEPQFTSVTKVNTKQIFKVVFEVFSYF